MWASVVFADFWSALNGQKFILKFKCSIFDIFISLLSGYNLTLYSRNCLIIDRKLTLLETGVFIEPFNKFTFLQFVVKKCIEQFI